jgi:hypothetical protein
MQMQLMSRTFALLVTTIWASNLGHRRAAPECDANHFTIEKEYASRRRWGPSMLAR